MKFSGNRFLKCIFCSLALLMICSCQMYEPSKQDEEIQKQIPESFIGSNEQKLQVDKKWWLQFGNEQLNEFIGIALQNNPNIGEIYARLNAVEAQAKIARTQLLPTLDASASASAGLSHSNGSTNGTEGYGLSLSAGYELDLWGKINASIESSKADVLEAQMNAQTAISTLVSNVVIAWVQIQSEMAYRQLLEDQLKVNEETLQSLAYRFAKGQSDNILDLLQQEQTLNSTRNKIPLSKQSQNAYTTKLCLLLGKPANENLEITPSQIPELIELPTSGIPSQVLEERPDIKAAKYNLYSAAWTLAEVKADLLPKIALSSSVPILSFSSNSFSSLFEAWTLQATAMISQPIFDGGKRLWNIEYQQAVALESFNTYKYTILSALKEVQDSIVNENTQKDYIVSLERSYENSIEMLIQSSSRYQKGVSDYLDVVSSIITAQGLAQDLILAKRDLLTFRVNLYSSLGGSWIPEISDKVEKEKNEDFEKSNFAPLQAKVLGQFL